MGFFKSKAESIQADIASGDADRLDRAADAVVHAMLEGAGSYSQNLADLTQAIKDSKEGK